MNLESIKYYQCKNIIEYLNNIEPHFSVSDSPDFPTNLSEFMQHYSYSP